MMPEREPPYVTLGNVAVILAGFAVAFWLALLVLTP
jgi:hypothetical protein